MIATEGAQIVPLFLDRSGRSGWKIIGDPLLGSGMFKFLADPGIFSANIFGVEGGGEPDLSLFRIQVSTTAPIPASALLVFASGLIALISRIILSTHGQLAGQAPTIRRFM